MDTRNTGPDFFYTFVLSVKETQPINILPPTRYVVGVVKSIRIF